jgi:hypothetical protein
VRLCSQVWRLRWLRWRRVVHRLRRLREHRLRRRLLAVDACRLGLGLLADVPPTL